LTIIFTGPDFHIEYHISPATNIVAGAEAVVTINLDKAGRIIGGVATMARVQTTNSVICRILNAATNPIPFGEAATSFVIRMFNFDGATTETGAQAVAIIFVRN